MQIAVNRIIFTRSRRHVLHRTKKKKTIVFYGTPHRHLLSLHNHHRDGVYPLYITSFCPAHLTHFPQECFHAAVASLFVTTDIIRIGPLVAVSVSLFLSLFSFYFFLYSLSLAHTHAHTHT